MKKTTRFLALVLALILAWQLGGCAGKTPEPAAVQTTEATEVSSAPKAEAEANGAADEQLLQTAQWLMTEIPEPSYGSVGGEWAVFGLARSGVPVPEAYFEAYGENVAAYVAEHGGVLHAKKYTEYSRVILAWTAMGRDAADVGGYNLLQPLADFEQTVFQGINGPIFALLALDSGKYEIPENTAGTTQATREEYVDYILSAELPGGGWTLAGDQADADITAMALQALAKYRDRQDVSAAVERGLTVLSALQTETGGYQAYEAESSESIAQVLVALTELGVDPEDTRFVKDGHTLQGRLLDFRNEDGSFRHILDGEADLMATEQAFYALVALDRAARGESTLYSMAD